MSSKTFVCWYEGDFGTNTPVRAMNPERAAEQFVEADNQDGSRSVIVYVDTEDGEAIGEYLVIPTIEWNAVPCKDRR